MKHLLNSSLRGLFALAFASACAVGVARADVRDARVISARAGGVNFVSGDVKVRREGSQGWRALTTRDELKGGDTVRTGAGQVEVLLNPGSYFRAGAATEFTMAEADLDDLRIELARGGAVVEATGYGDMNLSIVVATPRGVVRIVRSGVYRVNVPAVGPTELSVTKGRALLGETVVKGGKFARAVEGGGVEVTKLDKENRDALDLWSRERGKELAKANERLTHHAMSSAFAQSSFDSMFYASQRSHGFWFWNASSRCYTFLPFYANWRSPYGFGYDTGVRPYGYRGGGGGETWTPGQQPSVGGSNPNAPGGSWPGGGGAGQGGGARTPSTPMTPPARVDPSERPMRERTIEPGHRP